MNRSLPLLLLIVLWTVGCGSESNDIFGATSPSNPTALAGRLAPGDPLEGAVLRVGTLDGEEIPIPPTTTNASGLFLVNDIILPGEFRLTLSSPAVTQGQGNTYFADIHGFSNTSGAISVNAVSTLISMHRQAYPEHTYAESEALVRDFLEIPADVDLGWELDGPDSPFSHQAFFREAEQQGGVSILLTQLLAELEAGRTHPFTFDETASGGPSFWNRVGTGIVTGLTTGFIKDAIGFGLGKLASLMGFNFGNGPLDQISKQLSEILQGIDAIEQEIREESDESDFLAAFNQLQNVIQPVVGPSQTLTTLAESTTVTDVPQPVNQDVQSLLQSIASVDATGTMTSLSQALVDPAHPDNVFTYLTRISKDKAGITGAQTFEVRSDAILGGLYTALQYYGTWMTNAMNLASEAAYATSSTGEMDVALRAARLNLRSATRHIKGWNAQIPAPLNSHVLVDWKEGYMYNLRMQGMHNFFDVVLWSECKTSRYLGYTDWQAAHEGHVKVLYDRAKAANPNDHLAALQSFGFDLSPIYDSSGNLINHHVWMMNNQSTYDCERNTAQVADPHSFSLNSGRSETPSASTRLGWFYVRVFPNPNQPTDTSPAMLRALGTLQNLTVEAVDSSTVKAEGAFEISTKRGTVNGNADVTDRMVWTSSDPAHADVSNASGMEGQIQWRRKADGSLPDPVTIVASNYPVAVATDGTVTSNIANTFHASVRVSPPALAAQAVQTLNVTPINLLIDGTNGGFPETRKFSVTAFLEDGSIRSVTQEATLWVTEMDGTTPVPDTDIHVSTTVPGDLTFERNLGGETYLLHAEYTLNGEKTKVETKLQVGN